MVSVASVAPPMFVPFFRHGNVGDGEPEAATVNDAVPPVQADVLDGWVVTPGPVLTVSSTELVVAEPHELVATQSYDAASDPDTGLIVKDADVAPGMLTVF